MIKKIELESSGMGFGPQPEPDAIVEEKIIIHVDGDASLSSYQYGDGHPYKLASTKTYHL